MLTNFWIGAQIEHFVEKIAALIRERCAPDFIISLKMPADEGVDGGIDPDQAERITRGLCGQGLLDYLAYGQGNFSTSLENHVPDMHFEQAPFITTAGRRRARVGARGHRAPPHR